MEYNIYCDESCHLENDHQKIMAFGAGLVSNTERQRIVTALHALKEKQPCQWRIEMDESFAVSGMIFILSLYGSSFRNLTCIFAVLLFSIKVGWIIRQFNEGSHDTFYYKMYFSLLNKSLAPIRNITFISTSKDTRSRIKLRKLQRGSLF